MADGWIDGEGSTAEWELMVLEKQMLDRRVRVLWHGGLIAVGVGAFAVVAWAFGVI